MIKTIIKLVRAFNGNRNGSPALEFALISPLFFAAVFGTFEIGRALHERNRIGGAAAIATRTLALNTAATDTEIIADIKNKLSNYADEDLVITLVDHTIAGQAFKEIHISYDFDLLINVGHKISSFTLSATRFAPVIGSGDSSSSGDSSTDTGDSGSEDPGSSGECKGKGKKSC